MKISARYFIIGVALLGVAGSFYFKSRHIVAAEHRRFDRNLERIRRLDSVFNQDVLKVRFHLLEDYDSFGEQAFEIGELLKDLNAIPGFVDDSGQATISRKIHELSQLQAEKSKLVETFKSQNAVLKNSLRYFPLAGSELVKRLNAAGDHRELEIPFNELMRQVLAYSIVPSAEQEQEIRTTLAQIDDWRASHPEDAEAGIVGSLSAHARAILNRQPRVETLVGQLVSLPTEQRAEEVAELYEKQFAQAMKSVELYRGFLYALCIALVTGIAYAFLALRAANVHLERRRLDLARNNVELQREIAERKQSDANLKKAHKELLEASRQAGMAEVATGVLHNVGNVLNSVNIASSCVADSLRKSKSANLSKVVTMLREHEGDLGTFLTSDPKGKQIPGYLAQLAEHLAGEQTAALKELSQLQKNIEHIKDIVSMQQGFAKVSGVTETLQITDLVEDALRMNASSLMRHDIQVIREFEKLTPIMVEKQKVLQILVNLVRNAKHACDDSGRPDKRLTLRVTNGNQLVRIAVADNGIGILPENLTRIFFHGFTTKKDGHGFGLHSGALAAKEMGGSLTVHSDGPGQGAAFTLELPLQSPGGAHG